ncbi:MAG: glycosyltransferase [Saprospiraceae bacterium]|nr:glycosyltransferase [Saprospiraceae bacterium]MCB0678130.1 glycosyltransferase [Saprospiraceae bacterium]MCB0682849.1 glycosyltransferase [Saprospiraceae bacterium]
MTFWWILACTLALAYAVLMALYFRAWRSIPVWETPADYRPHTRLSVLVPARNEEARIDACLQALLAVDYPPELLEVLIIDDFSDDQTAARVLAVEDPRLRLIRLADEESLPAGNFGKKQALATGVRHATGALIATTDADCLPSPDWLRSLASFYEAGHWKIMAGPVQFVGEKNAFQRFQSLDMLGMVGATGGGIFRQSRHMANGANLAYEKAAFEQIGGFSGIDHLASGDDVLLIQKMAAHFPGQIGFLKSTAALVSTFPMPDWPAFFRQRLRWATKNSTYSEKLIILQLGLVFACSWAIVGAFLLACFQPAFWGPFALLLAVKAVCDYLFLREIAGFFHRRELLRGYPLSQLYHIGYIAVVGLAANLRKQYVWKGRRLR